MFAHENLKATDCSVFRPSFPTIPPTWTGRELSKGRKSNEKMNSLARFPRLVCSHDPEAKLSKEYTFQCFSSTLSCCKSHGISYRLACAQGLQTVIAFCVQYRRRSKSCVFKKSLTASMPKETDAPRSFGPQCETSCGANDLTCTQELLRGSVAIWGLQGAYRGVIIYHLTANTDLDVFVANRNRFTHIICTSTYVCTNEDTCA